MTTEKHITFNIFGSCIPRDIFNKNDAFFNYEIYDERDSIKTSNEVSFDILKFVNFCSPLFFRKKSCFFYNIADVIVEKYLNLYPKTKNFYLKCLKLAFTKEFIPYILSEKSDYIILDAAWYRITYIKDMKGELYGSTLFYRAFIKYLKAEQLISSEQVYSIDDFDDNLICSELHSFIKIILKHYPPNKIILLETKPALLNFDGDKVDMMNFKELNADLKRHARCFNLMQQMLPQGIHVIPAPELQLADLNHRWGAYSLHYVNEIYAYYLQAVSCAVQNLSLEEERTKINQSKLTCITELLPKVTSRLSEILNQRYENCSLSEMDYIVKTGFFDSVYVQKQDQQWVLIHAATTTSYKNIYPLFAQLSNSGISFYFITESNNIFYIGDILQNGHVRISKRQGLFDWKQIDCTERYEQHPIVGNIKTRFGCLCASKKEDFCSDSSYSGELLQYQIFLYPK